MKQFLYLAKDLSGRKLSGAVEALDQRAAIKAVTLKGCHIISIHEARGKKDLFTAKIKLDALLAFTRHLKVMLETGIDLLTSLNIIWAQTADVPMQLVISEMRMLLSKGVPLASALKRFPVVFSDIYVSLVSVGEKGGVLPFALEKIIEYLIRQRELMRKVQKALAYPVFVLALAILVFLGMFLFFVPMFTKIFQRMNIEMPTLTQYLINISDFFIKYWWILFLAYIILHIAIVRFLKTKQGRYFFDRYCLQVPLIGELIFYVCLSRFLHTFYVLLESGVLLVETLTKATDSMGNVFLKEKLQSVQMYLGKGMRLSDALEKIKMIPDFSLSLISIGEETGTLAKNIKVAASMVDENVDFQIDKLTSMIGPIAILFVSFLVGIVLVGIYLPIFSMWGGLAR